MTGVTPIGDPNVYLHRALITTLDATVEDEPYHMPVDATPDDHGNKLQEIINDSCGDLKAFVCAVVFQLVDGEWKLSAYVANPNVLQLPEAQTHDPQ